MRSASDASPADGPVVILLHGWPYDIYAYVDVAPRLASAGYRVIVPYLRGFGTTTFVSGSTVRNGQQSAVASDIIALMDALKIEKAVLGGFDWGARTVCAVAVLWPERCKALVSVSGYLITVQLVMCEEDLEPEQTGLACRYGPAFGSGRSRSLKVKLEVVSLKLYEVKTAGLVTEVKVTGPRECPETASTREGEDFVTSFTEVGAYAEAMRKYVLG